MAKKEIYVSTDVESGGPIPGPYSLYSFASAAYTGDKKLVGTFSRNLEEIPGTDMHPDQKKFWDANPVALAECRKDPQPIVQAMQEYLQWLKALPGVPVFVGFPAAYDYMFVHWYLHNFAGESPFGPAALDIKTALMFLQGFTYKNTSLSKIPRSWFDNLPHTHIALDDAIEQGALFCNALSWAKELKIDELLLNAAKQSTASPTLKVYLDGSSKK